MKIHTSAEILIPKPIEAVFDFSVADDAFTRVLKPFGPIPGITKVEVDGGGPQVTGSIRTATMTDRSTLREQVVLLERPREHRYRWLTRPAKPFSFLVKGGEARWMFHPEGAGTRLHWTYDFDLTSPLAYPAMRLVTIFFNKWMHQGLGNIRTALGG